MSRYYIEWWKGGKRKRRHYDTLEAARAAAGYVFRDTGIVLGIQKEKEERDENIGRDV